METNICILGSEGNMGRRYAAICEYLGFKTTGYDLKLNNLKDLANDLLCFTHCIIATPTRQHTYSLQDVEICGNKRLKVLCEKPIGLEPEDMDQVQYLIEMGYSIYMVNNYAYYSEDIATRVGPTHYKYYNSGNDGLAADCIQLIHLANDSIELNNKGVIWDCMINGVKLNRENIDLTYIKMLKDFFSNGELYGRLWGFKDILRAHDKVKKFEDSNRHTS